MAGDDRRRLGDAARPSTPCSTISSICSARARAPSLLVFTNAVGICLFLYLIKLSLVLVPNAQLQTSAGLGLPLGWVYAAIPIGSALIILPMLRNRRTR